MNGTPKSQNRLTKEQAVVLLNKATEAPIRGRYVEAKDVRYCMNALALDFHTDEVLR